MMSRKKNKLSIVTTFIVGTTMLTSMDKAWGMLEAPRPLSPKLRAWGAGASSSKPQEDAEKKMLVGTTLVRRTEVKAAQVVLNFLDMPHKSPYRQEALGWIDSSLQELVKGGMGRVMVEEDRLSSGQAVDSLIKKSLEAIVNAKEDPFHGVDDGKTKSQPLDDTYMESNATLLFHPESDEPGVINTLVNTTNSLANKLQNLNKQYPNIVVSLLARLPKVKIEKVIEGKFLRDFKNYFEIEETEENPLVSQGELTTEQIKRVKDDYRKNGRNFLQILRFLEQKEQELRLSITPESSSSIPLPEPVQPFSSSSDITPSLAVEEAPRFTYRTTAATLSAKNKHSAVAIQLSDEDLKYPAYQLTVNHRTGENGSSVRIFIPGIDYSPLGGLPSSVGFEDKDFDLSPWVEAVRGDSSSPSAIKTFLSFVGGQSDVHSFKIRSGERTLKEVIFGNVDSESQPGIHVYAPETDGDANEWSGVKSDDVQR